jgi:hypothetical protein
MGIVLTILALPFLRLINCGTHGLAREVRDPNTVLYQYGRYCPFLSFQHASSLIKPHSNVPVPPASVPGRSVTVDVYHRTQDPAGHLPRSNRFDVPGFANCVPKAPQEEMFPRLSENGSGTVAETRIQGKNEKTPKCPNDLAANPALWTEDLAETLAYINDPKYARASPCAGWAGRRAVSFAPDRAASLPCFAAAARGALRRAPECAAAGWEPPCATVAAARALHHALRCLPCAGRLSGRKRRRCTPTRATRSRAHCGTVRPRALALCARTRLCAVSLRWRARARSTRWVGFFRRRRRRDLQRRSRSIPRPGKKQSQACSRW